MNWNNLNLNEITKGNRKIYFWSYFVVLILLSLFMIHSYGLHPSFDFYFHFKRLTVLMEAIRNGTFPVYIDHTAANGYGYVTKWFYPDLMLVPFAYIGLLKDAVFAYQSMWFVMTVLCGLSMYYAVNRIFKNPYAAFVSGILFTFCMYRLLDIYTRSAVGEALSFTFVPIVFLGLYEVIYGNYKKWYILAIGFSLMIFTHILSTFLMFVTVVIILLICFRSFLNDKRRFYALIVAGVATLLITAYFLYPMLEQMFSNSFYYETVVKAHPNDHKQGIHWIIWGLFIGVIHTKQMFIPGIGVLLTWAVCLRLFVYDKTWQLKWVDTGVIIGLVFIFMVSSFIPWNVFPFSKLVFIQLPWRLYEFVSFFFALAGGYYMSCILKSDIRRFWGAALVCLFTLIVLSSSGRDYQVVGEMDKRDFYEIPTIERNNFHLYGQEYVPSKVPSLEWIDQRGDKIATKGDSTIISGYRKENGITSFTVVSEHPETLELPLFYYKGYRMAYDNDRNSEAVVESDNGLVEISATRSGKIRVWYEGTMIQKISPYISLVSIILLCVYIFFNRKSRTNEVF